MNLTVLMGRLTRDPELRHTQAGTPVTSFTMAVDRHGKEKQTDFIDCLAWRGTAEFVKQYFSKGQMIAITGRLQIRDWTDKDGNKRRSAEVVADHVYFTEGKKSDSKTPFNQPGIQMSLVGDFAELEDDDGDLPF